MVPSQFKKHITFLMAISALLPSVSLKNLVPQPSGLICHHFNKDVFGQSMNSWLDPSMDATRFYTAADDADFVSLMFWHLFHSLPYYMIQNSHVIYHGELLLCPIYT